jgi:hypothetical protein
MSCILVTWTQVSGLPRCMYACRNQNQNSWYCLLGLPFWACRGYSSHFYCQGTHNISSVSFASVFTSTNINFQRPRDNSSPLEFQSAILKESVDDLEWPGSSIQIRFQPDPPSVIFKGEGHGDLEVRISCFRFPAAFNCVHNSELLTPFCRLSSPTMQIPIF